MSLKPLTLAVIAPDGGGSSELVELKRKCASLVTQLRESLPPGWKTKTDTNGRRYFYRSGTKETQWKRPRGPPFVDGAHAVAALLKQWGAEAGTGVLAKWGVETPDARSEPWQAPAVPAAPTLSGARGAEAASQTPTLRKLRNSWSSSSAPLRGLQRRSAKELELVVGIIERAIKSHEGVEAKVVADTVRQVDAWVTVAGRQPSVADVLSNLDMKDAALRESLRELRKEFERIDGADAEEEVAPSDKVAALRSEMKALLLAQLDVNARKREQLLSAQRPDVTRAFDPSTAEVCRAVEAGCRDAAIAREAAENDQIRLSDLQARAAESYRTHALRADEEVEASQGEVERMAMEVAAARREVAAAVDRLHAARGGQLRATRQLERIVRAKEESAARFAAMGVSTAALRKAFADAMRVQQRNEDLAKRLRVIVESAIGVVGSARERRAAELEQHTTRCDAELVDAHRVLWRQLVVEEIESRSDAEELGKEIEKRRKQKNSRMLALMPWEPLEVERVALLKRAEALRGEARAVDLRAAPAYEALRESGVSVTHPHAAVQAEIRATYIESERELARQCLGESQLLRRLVEVESPTSIFALEEVVVMEKAVSIVTRFAIAGSDSGSDGGSSDGGSESESEAIVAATTATATSPRTPTKSSSGTTLALSPSSGAAKKTTSPLLFCDAGDHLRRLAMPRRLQIMTPPTRRAVGQWLEQVAVGAGTTAAAAAAAALRCAGEARVAVDAAVAARARCAEAGVSAAIAAATAAARFADDAEGKARELCERNEATKRKGDLRVQELRDEAENADRRRTEFASLQREAETRVSEFSAEHEDGGLAFMREIWRLLPALLEPSAFADLPPQRQRRKILGALHPDKVCSARERGEITPLDEAVANATFIQIEALSFN